MTSQRSFAPYRTALTHHGFQVKTANNARQALESHAYWHPDIILLLSSENVMIGCSVVVIGRPGSAALWLDSPREWREDGVSERSNG